MKKLEPKVKISNIDSSLLDFDLNDLVPFKMKVEDKKVERVVVLQPNKKKDNKVKLF